MTTHLSRLAALAALGLSLLYGSGIALADPVGTGFTYQGELKYNGVRLNGEALLSCSLWDLAVGGTQQGATVNVLVGVSDGLFQTYLDFDVAPYAANQLRWLEITVEGETLTPRQPLRPTPFALNTRGINVDVAGKVGIGTTSPTGKLHVIGGPLLTDYGLGFSNITQGPMAAGTHISAPAGDTLALTTAGTERLRVNNLGRVGIGTSNPAAPLHVSGSGLFPHLKVSAGAGAVAGAFLSLDGTATAGGKDWLIFSTGGSAGEGQGKLVFQNQTNAINTATMTATGNVGIGTLNPALKLHIDGGTDAEPTAGGYFMVGGSAGLNMVMDNNEIMAREDGETATLFLNNDGGEVHCGARMSANSVEIRGGSDVAEPFDVQAGGEVEPGTVMCIDAANPGKLCMSQRSYDRTVAGIVSGAGGVKTGLLLTQKGSLADGDHPVALSGRVYCKVDADAGGPVMPGDLLTTSNTCGHAMKVSDPAQAHGAVLGKAMTSLESGKGLVLVLVSLQ